MNRSKQNDVLFLNYLKTFSFVDQQNLTEEMSHEGIVFVEGEIYALVNFSKQEPSNSAGAHFGFLM